MNGRRPLLLTLELKRGSASVDNDCRDSRGLLARTARASAEQGMRIEPICSCFEWPVRAAPAPRATPGRGTADTLFEAYDRQAASDPFAAVDAVFDLSRGGRSPVASLGLTRDDFKLFLGLTARLIQSGIVGYEIVEFDEQPYQSFLTTRMVEPRLRGAKLYRQRLEPASRVDVAA